MNHEYTLADLKHKQLHYAIKPMISVTHAKLQFKKLLYRRWFIDNILIFFIQFNGFLVYHYVLNHPLIYLTTGIACALLFLKGDAILPGLFLSTACAQFLQSGKGLDAIYFSFYQILPLLCLRHYAYCFIAPSFIHLPIKKKMMLSLGLLMTAAFLTCSTMRNSSITLWLIHFFAEFNGLLIIMLTVMMLDLYLVDWLELRQKTQQVHSTFLLLCTIFILLFALIQQGMSFFVAYDDFTIVILQSILFFYALFNLYQFC